MFLLVNCSMGGVLSDEIGGLSSSGFTGFRGVLVALENSLGKFHRVTAEGISELLGDHHFDDSGLSVNLVLGGLLDSSTNVGDV